MKRLILLIVVFVLTEKLLAKKAGNSKSLKVTTKSPKRTTTAKAKTTTKEPDALDDDFDPSANINSFFSLGQVTTKKKRSIKEISPRITVKKRERY